MMKKNHTARLGALALALTLVSTCLMGGTLAKYTTTVTGTATATVAKWVFNAYDATDNTKQFNVKLTDTALNGKVTAGKIAPGTDGSFTIEIDATDSEVALDYIIAFSNIINKPKNLSFYSDEAFNTKIENLVDYSGLNGSIGNDEKDKKTDTKTIYWKWPYEGNDGANDSDDTSSGKTAGEMTFTITVTGTQQEPSKAVNS